MIGLDLDLAPHLQALESRKQNALEAQRDAARAQRAEAHHWVRKVSWAMLAWERHTAARHGLTGSRCGSAAGAARSPQCADGAPKPHARPQGMYLVPTT